MKGSVSHELDAAATAGEVWEVYGTLRLAEMVPRLLPGMISKIDVEQGDGGVDTVLCVTLNPELPGSKFYKEKFVTVDNEKRVKEAKVTEGGFLDMGFSSYLVRFEILEKNQDSSTIRSTIEYEIGDDNAASASFVNTGALAVIAEGVAKHFQEKKAGDVKG